MRLDTPSINNYTYDFDAQTASSGATIESVGNGWFYCTASVTATSTQTGVFYVNVTNADLYLWGMQFEVGSYATSYIPTTSASVTRNADVISKTGISSLIGQTEGTLFIDTYIKDISAQTNDPVLIYVKGTTADAYIEFSDSGRVYGVFFDGSAIGFINANVGLQNGRHKIAFGYKDNDFTLFLDGAEIGTDTSGVISSSLTEFGLQYYDNFFRGTQSVNAAALWKTRLDNATLASLTTL
jgi:hypothetical protein